MKRLLIRWFVVWAVLFVALSVAAVAEHWDVVTAYFAALMQELTTLAMILIVVICCMAIAGNCIVALIRLAFKR